MFLSGAKAIAVGALCQLVCSAPTDQDFAPRLIKISEGDPGRWVTEEEKFRLYRSKRVGFYDITDVTDDEVLSVLSTPSSGDAHITRRAVNYPTILGHVTDADSLISKIDITGPQSWVKNLSDFYNRHYRSSHGTDASNWVFDQVKALGSVNPSILVSQFNHSAFNQPSVIARIPGQTDELVIVGAHFDSIAGSYLATAPGADDNASGSATLLETLRVLANSRFTPQNTLEFHFYAGEEGGLLGSQDVWANYKSTGKEVVAFLNQDMTGISPNGRVAVYTDYVDAPLTEYVRLIATQFTGLTPSTSTCGYACSDHASARSNGFPAALVSEDVFNATNPYIHTINDSYDKVQWPTVLRHIKLTIGFLVEASYL